MENTQVRSKKPNKGKKQSANYFDYSLVFLVLCLACFGLMMIYSTTSYNDLKTYGDAFKSTKSQLVYLTLMLLLAFGVIARMDYHIFTDNAFLLYLIDAALLVFVLVFGSNANGSTRWIYIGPISLQPSEFAKPAVILLLSRFFTSNYGGFMYQLRPPKRVDETGRKIRHPKSTENFWYILIPAVLCFIIFIFVFVENLSTAIIIFVISYAMMFIADKRKKKYLVVGGFLALIVLVVVVCITNDIKLPLIKGYQMERITAWKDPLAYKDKTGYQILQGLYAIGSGGLLGKGLGSSIQKLGYLPEAQNDMVFAIICEELGFLGAAVVLVLFMLVLWRILLIAMNAPDITGFLLCTGVFIHFALQVCMNIAVVTNSMPNTGVCLPFISSGGSALMVNIGELALVLAVSRQIKEREVKPADTVE